MRRPWLAAVIGAVALLFSGTGYAQDPAGPDEVTLKNGGTVRGTVVSSEPGVSVKIIEMGGKETRVIPWGEVSDVERGKYLPKAQAQPGPAGPGYGGAPPPQPQPVAPPAPQMGSPGVVRLHIESPETVRLFEHAPLTYAQVGAYGVVIDQRRQICVSPCDEVIDGRRGQIFSAAGDFPGSKSFTLAERQGDVELTVDPGSSGLRTLGVVTVALGGAAILGGILVAVLGSISVPETVCDESGCHDKPEDKSVSPAAIGLLVGGGVGVVGGIVLIVASRTGWDLHDKSGAPGAKTAKAVKPRYHLGEF